MNLLIGEDKAEESAKLFQNEYQSEEKTISINNEENEEEDFYNENATKFEVSFYRWIQLASYTLALVINNICLVGFTSISS